MTTEYQDEISFNEDDQRAIQEYRIQGASKDAIRIYLAKPLGWFSVFCVISNRMIGSGIFRTPDVVIQETESIAAAMLFWVLGALVTLAGATVYVEFGLATPYIFADGAMQSVPSNGGEKNYLEHVYRRPRRLITCIFGILFVCWGNMAGNALLFSRSIYIAITGRDPSDTLTRLVAIGAATFACVLHIYSRKVGIWLNNGFGLLKVLILLSMAIVAAVSLAGALGTSTIADAKVNYATHGGFVNPPSGSYGYASSFLAILFTYSGFNQANYILGNVRQPRRLFKREVFSAVGTICFLYICLNMCYYGIVPYSQLLDRERSVFSSFVARTMSATQSDRIAAAIQAFSSLGNVVIQTFTAARVKQEIAKEGVLPWSKFFAANRSLNWRFWRDRARREETGEATPVGALILHWVFCIVFILGSWPLTALNAYRLYVSISSFATEALIGSIVGVGLLYLRISDYFTSGPKWADISRENRWLSSAAALVYTVGNVYPLVAIWLQPPLGQPRANKSTVPYWITGTLVFATVGCSLLYWFVLEYVYPAITEQDLVVERQYFTHKQDKEIVVTNEIVSIAWMSR